MGRLHLEFFDKKSIYECVECEAHFTHTGVLVSKNFHGSKGKAYLFDKVINITTGPQSERMMMTGLHKVCDIFCKQCYNCIGWKYVSVRNEEKLYAYEQSQKYKEGKFIIERANIRKFKNI